MAPLHPEITYAERSSASEPEKVGFDFYSHFLSLRQSQQDFLYGSVADICDLSGPLNPEYHLLHYQRP